MDTYNSYCVCFFLLACLCSLVFVFTRPNSASTMAVKFLNKFFPLTSILSHFFGKLHPSVFPLNYGSLYLFPCLSTELSLACEKREKMNLQHNHQIDLYRLFYGKTDENKESIWMCE